MKITTYTFGSTYIHDDDVFSGFIFSYYLGVLSYLYALPYPPLFLFINTTGLCIYVGQGGGLVRVDLLSLYVHTYVIR